MGRAGGSAGVTYLPLPPLPTPLDKRTLSRVDRTRAWWINNRRGVRIFRRWSVGLLVCLLTVSRVRRYERHAERTIQNTKLQKYTRGAVTTGRAVRTSSFACNIYNMNSGYGGLGAVDRENVCIYMARHEGRAGRTATLLGRFKILPDELRSCESDFPRAHSRCIFARLSSHPRNTRELFVNCLPGIRRIQILNRDFICAFK